MYNPFPLLQAGMLKEMLESGKRWFVRQTYARGKSNASCRAAFLFRAYSDAEAGLARQHMEYLGADAYARLYDADNAAEAEKLAVAASQPQGYEIYYAGSLNSDWQPPAEYRHRIRNYIRSYHSAWKPKTRAEAIRAGIHEKYGELFLKLSFKDEEEMIPFELIEKT